MFEEIWAFWPPPAEFLFVLIDPGKIGQVKSIELAGKQFILL
jgi:hypothetical protein